MAKSNFEELRAAKAERLQERADKKRREGESAINAGREALNQIPLGQPIMVGHYSEKADRSYRGRAVGKIDKGRELISEADRLAARAKAMEQNTAIFSDDPAAQDKLDARIEQLTARQERMKAANKLVKKQDREGLLDMGYTDKQIDRLFTPDFCQRVGYPDYEIANNGANIRRLKERKAALETQAKQKRQEFQIGDIRIDHDPDENRTQVYFPGKPSEATRTELKSYGFHWTPSLGCWQRNYSNQALWAAKSIAEKVSGNA